MFSFMTEVNLPSLLSSEWQLRQYMSGEEQIQTIAKEAANPPASSLWQGKWQVVILTARIPFDCILVIFWEATRGLTYVLCMPTLSTYCHIRGVHAMAADLSRLYDICRFGENLLVPSINFPKSSLADLCAHPSLSREVVKSNPLLTDTRKGSPVLPEPLEFFHKKGTCRGMSDWFLYLYFATKHLFSDPEEHLKAVARRMETGATGQATLLQTFSPSDGRSMLHLLEKRIHHPIASKPWGELSKSEQKDYFSYTFNTIPPKLFEKDHPEAKKLIRSLPSGAYHLGVPFHAMTFFKLSPTLAYLFDPNAGLIRMKGDMPQKVLDYCLDYKEDKRPLLNAVDFDLTTSSKSPSYAAAAGG